ncbi:MAG: ATP-binding cassette domain-containing protein [Sphaerospermopsis sp. SIO1G2]|nr:ATP-binding cassette domain-containing protein [Sphaerospermopsis sp. SIO1G2]
MIICKNIRQTFAINTHTLVDVNLELRAGGFYFLTGPSGAGKTTLLNILSLTMAPSAGTLMMFGQNVLSVERHMLPVFRRRIGCVYQDYRLLNHLSVFDNIALPQKITGMPEEEYIHKTEELLDWIHMRRFRDAFPETLSGGEKQRVAIARAVINNPAVIIADEPTGNLDPQLSNKVMHLFEALNRQGATVLIATHDTHLLDHFDHTVLTLEQGKISAAAA